MTSHHAAGRSTTPAAKVTAVIVAHNGERWLPTLFTALESTTRFPDRLVAVDTGSTDSTATLLCDTLGSSVVLEEAASTGFGAAVQTALDWVDTTASGEPDGWVWLLHDDCAPAPDALEQLLAVGESDPSISVVGGRVRAWPRARRLLEVGVTITGTGHRETGVELGEYDQGQHDEQRDVLSVSSAGMLVRRSTWDALGGLERRLPLFRDDLDFGWRVAKAGGRVVIAPQAVVFHAEAAARGVRALDDLAHVPPSPHRAEREASLFTLLANCRGLALPFQYVRLFVGSLLRALAYLVGKLPTAARDEALAMVSVLGRPGRILGARARRRRITTAPHRAVRALLPHWWTPYLNALDSLLNRFAGTLRDTAAQVAAAARRRRSGAEGVEAVESGPVPDEAVNLPTGPGPVVWTVGHPLLSLAILLTVAAAFGTRDLWGGGWLQGGGLLPAPVSASSWWNTYTESWHHVGMGSREVPSPYLAVLAVASLAVLGKAWLAIQLLMVLAVPLAALGAYVAARRIVSSLAARVWMSVSYALLPALMGLVSAGRIGTTVAVVLLPWVFRVAVPMISAEDAGKRWRAVFASGLVLSGIVAFAPIAWPMALVLAVAGTVWLLRRKGAGLMTALQPVVAALLPFLLLVPWSWRLMSTPSLFLIEAGRVDPATPSIADHAWLVPWGRVGAPGDAPWWLSLGVVLAALVALLRADRRPRVLVAWAVILLGLATTAVLAVTVVTVPGTGAEAFTWTGFPVMVVQAAAIVAAGVAADGASRAIQTGTFGWRQPLAAFTALVALIAPVAGLLWWVGAAPTGALTRGRAVPLPAYMIGALQTDAEQRVLYIRADQATDGSWSDTYTVYAGDGIRLGDDSVLPGPDSSVSDLVTDLVSDAQPSDVKRLADLGIAFVAMPAPYDTDQVAQLDGVAGLTRSTDGHQLAGWSVGGQVGLVRVLDSGGKTTVLPSQDGRASSAIGPGADRLLVVSTSAGDGFSARLDGKDLPDADVPAGAGFTVGSTGGKLQVDPGGHRVLWLVIEGVFVLLAAVLAGPAVQRAPVTVEEDA